jgi:hypothetical protein
VERDRLWGQPLWLVLVILGAAGVAGYLIFFRNQGKSSADQGATGYSSQGLAVMQNPDESATMALQNQELSFLRSELEGGFGGLGQQIGAGFSGVGDQLTGISGQLTGVGGQLGELQQGQTVLGGQLGNLQNTVNGSTAANAAYYNSLLTNLINYANALSAQVQAGDQNAQQQLTATQAQIRVVGNQISDLWGPLTYISRGVNDVQNRMGLPPT